MLCQAALAGTVPGGVGGVVAEDARSARNTVNELDWFKSSYSGSEGDDCVEVAHAPGAVHVRDSKQQDGPRFTVSPSVWGDFLGCAGG
ncbi:DUF397 domain-containing protein [Streptomyces sp. GD-15H]|uniref:DUF397 domain-containing protein n=1 Tax=Streptomyces sp. GD-15H TaxID=3129112 RepID=UPI003872D605